jgi:hypothetical protein
MQPKQAPSAEIDHATTPSNRHSEGNSNAHQIKYLSTYPVPLLAPRTVTYCTKNKGTPKISGFVRAKTDTPVFVYLRLIPGAQSNQ